MWLKWLSHQKDFFFDDGAFSILFGYFDSQSSTQNKWQYTNECERIHMQQHIRVCPYEYTIHAREQAKHQNSNMDDTEFRWLFPVICHWHRLLRVGMCIVCMPCGHIHTKHSPCLRLRHCLQRVCVAVCARMRVSVCVGAYYTLYVSMYVNVYGRLHWKPFEWLRFFSTSHSNVKRSKKQLWAIRR